MKSDQKEYFFLLGGHDLEMEEIGKILEEKKGKFADRKLEWGARLSDYNDILNDTEHFIGIELTIDIEAPLHFIVIDHHNEKSSNPSSIEQVAEILNIKLNRWRQLVAANDHGYIRAMEDMGATLEEIRQIRLADRKAQGVTEADEFLAEESIHNNLLVTGGITVVKSGTSRFSAITDRLYPAEKLLIYNQNALNYYGTGAGKLTEAFSGLIAKGEGYSGGGSDGFFGIAKNALPIDDLIKMKEKIILLLGK